MLVLQVTASYNKVDADGHEEEWERYWRAWSWDTSSLSFINLIPFSTLKIIGNATFTCRIDVEAGWADETNEDALIDSCVIWLVFFWAVVHTCTFVKETIINTGSTSICFTIASLTWLLALFANTIYGKL